MTIEEATAGITRLIPQFIEVIKKETEITANNAIATIQDRVVEEGKNSDNGTYAPYSLSYKNYRIKHGRPVDHVNFSFTNDMWNSIGIVEEEVTQTSARIVVKGRDQFTNNKLEWNTEKKGPILKMTKEEEDRLKEEYAIDVEEKIKLLMIDYL